MEHLVKQGKMVMMANQGQLANLEMRVLKVKGDLLAFLVFVVCVE